MLQVCLFAMMIKLDTLAIPAQHAMSTKSRVELIFPSPSLEKGRQNHFQLLHMGKLHVWPFWAGTANQLPMYRDRGHIQGSFLHRKARRLAGGGEEAFISRGSKATVFVYFQKKRNIFGRPSVVDGANGRLFLELCDFLEIHMGFNTEI